MSSKEREGVKVMAVAGVDGCIIGTGP